MWLRDTDPHAGGSSFSSAASGAAPATWVPSLFSSPVLLVVYSKRYVVSWRFGLIPACSHIPVAPIPKTLSLSIAGGAEGVVKCATGPTCDPYAFEVTKQNCVFAVGMKRWRARPALRGFFRARDFPGLRRDACAGAGVHRRGTAFASAAPATPGVIERGLRVHWLSAK